MIAAELLSGQDVPEGVHGHLSNGDFGAALRLMEPFLETHPRSAAGLMLSGYCLLQAGRPAEALGQLSKAAAIDSRDSVCLNLLGNCLVKLDKKLEAVNVFRRAVAVNKACADSRNNLGMVLAELSQRDEAARHFQGALDLKPSHENARVNLLGLYLILKSYDEAHRLIEQGPPADQLSEECLSLCCDLYFNAKRFALSERAATSLVERFPSRGAYDKLNRCYLHRKNRAAFVACTLRINELYADEPLSLIHTITVLMDEGERKRSRDLLSGALLKNPENILANIANAYDLLNQRHWGSGWDAYEWRLRLENPQLHFQQKPGWDGSPLRGLRVLVLCEQGVGDVVLFARFLNDLLDEAGDVCLLCEARFRPVFERSFPGITCLSDPSMLGVCEYDVSIALASLGKAYGGRLEDIQRHSAGYIRVTPKLRSVWQGYFGRKFPSKAPRIGFSINAGLDEYNKQKRSCPFPDFLKLWPSSAMKMIDLDHFRDSEYDSRRTAAAAGGFDYTSLGNVTKDLEQLCAAISQLDLVITTQQTNAHICGACGVPCIVMLPPSPHYVYGYEGDATPWYSSLRLVRSKGWYRWEELADGVRGHVDKILEERER